MSLLLIVVIVLLLVGVGAGPWWGYSSGWGYGPSGIIGILLVVLLIWLLLGKV